jgi:hypothetical protein
MKIDLAAPADVFSSKRFGKRQVKYQRFETAAEAIRYVVEEIGEGILPGVVVEVNETRLTADAIRSIYASDGYPLSRLAAAA